MAVKITAGGAAVDKAFSSYNADELLRKLTAIGIPSGRIATSARRMTGTRHGARDWSSRSIIRSLPRGTPRPHAALLRSRRRRMAARAQGSPLYGQHTAQVLDWIGSSAKTGA